MKTIIKNNDETFIATCNHCESVFTYQKSDVSDWSHIVTCPVCNADYYHNDDLAEKYHPKEKDVTAESVGVVPVVRCKDCFYYKRDAEIARENSCDAEKWCGLLRIENGEDGFCNYGRRTEDVIAQREARGEIK